MAKKKKKKKLKIKDIISSKTFLTIIFLILLIIVCFLFIKVINKKKEKEKNPPANMVIPIYKDFSSYHFSISAKALSEKKTYILKITNYKDDEINQTDVKYKITINNSTSSKLDVNKKNELKDLMINQKEQTINGYIEKDKEHEDIYYIKMTSYKKLKEDDFIRVLVENREVEE